MPLKDREEYNEYMRKYREKKKQKLEDSSAGKLDLEKIKICGQFRRQVLGEEKRDSIFCNDHLTACARCQSWYAQQKTKLEKAEWHYEGSNPFGSEGNQPDQPKERTDLKSKSDFMKDFLDNPDLANKRRVPRILEDAERREDD